MSSNTLNSTVLINGKEVQVKCPEPIVGDVDVMPFKKKMDTQFAIEALVDGDFVVILDFFSTGLIVLNALRQYLEKKHSNQSFKGQREYRSEYRELSNQILVLVSNHRLAAKKSPEIGWFKLFYPELEEFLLPFPQVQGLNSAWQWYQKGISIPVLNQKVYPFFGTYFPTRFEHLILFDNWLKEFKGDKSNAIDIGVGSGVLSFQMLKHGFEKIIGTDVNPNAIIGLSRDKKNLDLTSKIELRYGDLFANSDEKSELIVFNPPWIPAGHDLEGIDKAIYYDSDLFPNFFSEAEKHLNPNGRVVLLFSNLAEVTNVSNTNPIEEEILNGGRFEKDVLIESSVNSASKHTRRNQIWRGDEKVQLWVLKLKT